MARTMLDLSADTAPVDVKKAKEIFTDCSSTFFTKVDEIEEQIKKGRYNRYAVIRGGKTMVNYFVYYDYSKYRKMLKDRHACKSAPPFNPQEIAEITPVSVVHHFAEGGGYAEKKD